MWAIYWPKTFHNSREKDKTFHLSAVCIIISTDMYMYMYMYMYLPKCFGSFDNLHNDHLNASQKGKAV